MATGKSYFARSNSKFRFLPAGDGIGNHRDRTISPDFDFVGELDESDLYNNSPRSHSPEFRSPATNSRISKRKSPAKVSHADVRDRAAAASLPVNIPDWSKILRNEYIENRRDALEDDDEVDGDDDYEDDGFRVPPHEFLARTRIASFSVHEGIGRTLKGRDLSRVRNAIWQKTGFED